MADEIPPAGTAAPVAVPAPVAPATTIDPGNVIPESALKPRLDQAERAGERKALEKLGLTEGDIESAKTVIAAAKAAAEANKSAEQRAADLAASLKTTQTEAARQGAIIKEHAARMIGVLTAEEQKAVRDIAGEDAAKQLQTIHALQPIWAKQQPAAPAVAPPPANTAPPPNAPGGAPGTSPPDHKAEYAAEQNPFKRAAIGARHPSVYTPKG